MSNAMFKACCKSPCFWNAFWLGSVLVLPFTRNMRSIANSPQMFLSFWGLVHSSSSVAAFGFLPFCPPGRSAANLATPPVSRNVVWFEALYRTRFAKSERQSWTTIPPWFRDPSACMRLNTLSKAFSNTKSFWSSDEDSESSFNIIKPAVRQIRRLVIYMDKSGSGIGLTIPYGISWIIQRRNESGCTKRSSQNTFLCPLRPCARYCLY